VPGEKIKDAKDMDPENALSLLIENRFVNR
jgi:hypothetical protein